MRHNIFTIMVLSFCLLCNAIIGFAAAPPDLERELREAPRREIAHGEDCIVCGAELDGVEGSFALEIRGVRIPISTKHFEALLRDPQHYIAQLSGGRPVFSERPRRANTPPTMLGMGLLVLGSLAFGGLAAFGAYRKGLAPGPWFLVGILANVVSLFLLSMQKTEARPVSPGATQSPA